MKRFSDTSRFEEEWYVDLPIEFKIAWEYVWAKCDNAGVWNPSLKLADFAIGRKIKWPEFIESAGGRIIVLPSGKWQVVGFVELQCGPRFSTESRPHQAIMGLLNTHGIEVSDSLSIVYVRGTNTPQYTDKEEDKDKTRTQTRARTGEATVNPPTESSPIQSRKRGTAEELIAFCESNGLPASDGQACFDKWQGNGWKNGQNPIADWQATIRSWKAHGYLPSQKTATTGRNGYHGTETASARHSRKEAGQYGLEPGLTPIFNPGTE